MSALAGTGGLVRLALRRDRIALPVWTLVLALVPVGFVSTYQELYPTQADRLGYARTSGTNPTFLALYGPLNDTGIGGIVAQRAAMIPVVLALVMILTVVRHTRTEEEAGRRELLGATVLGRGAPPAAALLVSAAASLAGGAVLTAGMLAQGLPAAGSAAFGAQFAAAGLLFAAVAALAAQLTESAAAARGIAIAVLGASYGLRLGADVGGAGNGLERLGWLTPLGWVQRIRPYGGERWWLLAVIAVAYAALVAAAARVAARRDLGAGVLPPRLGPATGALRGAFGLAWRLQSRTLYAWTAGFAALGLIYGGAAGGVNDLVKDNPDLQKIVTRIGGSAGIEDAFFASSMTTLGLIAAAYAVSAALRPRTEETAQRAEPLLATGTGRLRWAASHLAFAVLGPAVALTVAGAVTGLVHDPGSAGRLTGAALAQLPAVWLVAAVAVALFGLLPRLTPAAWGVLGVVALVSLFGPALDLARPVLDVSPFTHVPKLPGHAVAWTPLVVLTVLAALVGAAGLLGLRRRDMQTG
ncbi:ABC-2 family transporter protein [Actinomadura rubteroloni]|uniref:ABC-2 family transporter protein n=1 Tax=Actinomadura rubteroloni TaxID=1926885 RepID=A0A2P4UNP5_9ACTN|nr:ABC transporter permease [Actinomadura rubteroloni]POM26674.1 ABC-2 family transporter protein [Actinomadura rubteroloni]